MDGVTGGWTLERSCHLCPYIAPHDDALARHMFGHRTGGNDLARITMRQAHRAAGEDLERLLEELDAPG